MTGVQTCALPILSDDEKSAENELTKVTFLNSLSPLLVHGLLSKKGVVLVSLYF